MVLESSSESEPTAMATTAMEQRPTQQQQRATRGNGHMAILQNKANLQYNVLAKRKLCSQNQSISHFQEQLQNWELSEMNRVTSARRPSNKTRVKFHDSDVFLSACVSGDEEEVEGLLHKGADINASTVDGVTALHQAVIDGNLDIVRFLVEHHADIDAQDNEGWTPLHAAVCCGSRPITEYLCEQGADLTLINSDRELAMDLAEDEELKSYLAEQLRDKEIDIERCREREYTQLFADCMEWLRCGTYAERAHPRTGATALHVAASKGGPYSQLVGMLIKAGANVSAQDAEGWTPLHAAAYWAERDACRLLMEGGARLDALTKNGQTVRMVADSRVADYLDELETKLKLSALRNDSLIDNGHVSQASGTTEKKTAATSATCRSPVRRLAITTSPTKQLMQHGDGESPDEEASMNPPSRRRKSPSNKGIEQPPAKQRIAVMPPPSSTVPLGQPQQQPPQRVVVEQPPNKPQLANLKNLNTTTTSTAVAAKSGEKAEEVEEDEIECVEVDEEEEELSAETLTSQSSRSASSTPTTSTSCSTSASSSSSAAATSNSSGTTAGSNPPTLCEDEAAALPATYRSTQQQLALGKSIAVAPGIASLAAGSRGVASAVPSSAAVGGHKMDISDRKTTNIQAIPRPQEGTDQNVECTLTVGGKAPTKSNRSASLASSSTLPPLPFPTSTASTRRPMATTAVPSRSSSQATPPTKTPPESPTTVATIALPSATSTQSHTQTGAGNGKQGKAGAFWIVTSSPSNNSQSNEYGRSEEQQQEGLTMNKNKPLPLHSTENPPPGRIHPKTKEGGGGGQKEEEKEDWGNEKEPPPSSSSSSVVEKHRRQLIANSNSITAAAITTSSSSGGGTVAGSTTTLSSLAVVGTRLASGKRWAANLANNAAAGGGGGQASGQQQRAPAAPHGAPLAKFTSSSSSPSPSASLPSSPSAMSGLSSSHSSAASTPAAAAVVGAANSVAGAYSTSSENSCSSSNSTTTGATTGTSYSTSSSSQKKEETAEKESPAAPGCSSATSSIQQQQEPSSAAAVGNSMPSWLTQLKSSTAVSKTMLRRHQQQPSSSEEETLPSSPSSTSITKVGAESGFLKATISTTVKQQQQLLLRLNQAGQYSSSVRSNNQLQTTRADSESVRKLNSRQQRLSRRSTQGVTAEQINEALKQAATSSEEHIGNSTPDSSAMEEQALPSSEPSVGVTTTTATNPHQIVKWRSSVLSDEGEKHQQEQHAGAKDMQVFSVVGGQGSIKKRKETDHKYGVGVYSGCTTAGDGETADTSTSTTIPNQERNNTNSQAHRSTNSTAEQDPMRRQSPAPYPLASSINRRSQMSRNSRRGTGPVDIGALNAASALVDAAADSIEEIDGGVPIVGEGLQEPSTTSSATSTLQNQKSMPPTRVYYHQQQQPAVPTPPSNSTTRNPSQQFPSATIIPAAAKQNVARRESSDSGGGADLDRHYQSLYERECEENRLLRKRIEELSVSTSRQPGADRRGHHAPSAAGVGEFSIGLNGGHQRNGSSTTLKAGGKVGNGGMESERMLSEHERGLYERRIEELESELENSKRMQADLEKLREENVALIRVLTKLSAK